MPRNSTRSGGASSFSARQRVARRQRVQSRRLAEDVLQEAVDVHAARSPISQPMPPTATCVHSGRNVRA